MDPITQQQLLTIGGAAEGEYIDNVFDVIWDIQPSRIGDIKNSRADTSKLNGIGWRTSISLKAGLRRCVANVTN